MGVPNTINMLLIDVERENDPVCGHIISDSFRDVVYMSDNSGSHQIQGFLHRRWPNTGRGQVSMSGIPRIPRDIDPRRSKKDRDNDTPSDKPARSYGQSADLPE